MRNHINFIGQIYGGFIMKKQEYRPEGIIDPSDSVYLSGIKGLSRALAEDRILQAKCLMCDANHNLHLKIGGIKAIIPREETALGIKEGMVKDVAIITRVNKMVCFKVMKISQNEGDTVVYLSRRAAQQECENYIFENYLVGDIIDARITHMEQFGAFADIGCGVVSMISIDNISVSRIAHPKNRFYIGMDVKAVVKSIDYSNLRINLSHKELLGTWLENASMFNAGETVTGIVRSIESYGVFIELTPNLAGLAEVTQGVEVGNKVSVYIKSIIPQKMKIKLSIVDVTDSASDIDEISYMYNDNKIEVWKYSPPDCVKCIETAFVLK